MGTRGTRCIDTEGSVYFWKEEKERQKRNIRNIEDTELLGLDPDRIILLVMALNCNIVTCKS